MNDVNESILSILKMVKEGKISSEEGTELIEALFSKSERRSIRDGKLLIRVKSRRDNKEKIHVVIPWKMAKFFLGKWGIEEKVNLDELHESGLHIEDGDDIVDVEVVS